MRFYYKNLVSIGKKEKWLHSYQKEEILSSFNERGEPVGIAYKNTEGYCDPVPFAAFSNIDKEKKKFRPIVYICSPFSGDIEGNTLKARKYSRFAVDQGAIPIAPHLLLPQYMDEKTERELAMQMDMVLLAHCLEIWVFGSFISEGMEAEIARAKQKRMTIRYFTEDLKEEEKCS